MRLVRQIWSAMVGVLLASATCGASAFQDVLDVPAMKSALAARGVLNSIARAGERLVAVGQRGHIVYSDDNGQSWVQAAVPVSSDLTAVHFPSARKGWAVGHDGVVLMSADAGAHWEKQLDGRVLGKLMTDYYASPTSDMPASGEQLVSVQADAQRIADDGPDKPFLTVWFENETSGYVAGAFNLILRTDDGGKTWVPWFDRTENPGQLHFLAMGRAGNDVYLVGEQGIVLKLDPAKRIFRATTTGYKGSFFGLAAEGSSVLVFGLRGTVYRSTDGGANWEKVPSGVATTITGAATLGDGRTVLVSQGGQVLLPAPGGYAPLAGIRLASATAVVSSTANTLIVTGVRGPVVQPLKP